MNYLNENDYFQSADLSLVAALMSFGYSIETIDRTDGSRAIFLIARDKFLDEKVQAFWAHTLTVDPLAYFNCLKEAKTRLYNSS
ncbi:MAG: hypothetical protein Q7R89_01700 [bacterium]|nr:hypothetical protein [bacterium]